MSLEKYNVNRGLFYIPYVWQSFLCFGLYYVTLECNARATRFKHDNTLNDEFRNVTEMSPLTIGMPSFCIIILFMFRNAIHLSLKL